MAPNFNLFIDQNGTIAYSSRITLTVACNLDLVNYPMDSQKCGIRMVSIRIYPNLLSIFLLSIFQNLLSIFY
jgi:hypothetical protein